MVTFKATDSHGNTRTCTTSVKITDTEKPTIQCPSNYVGFTDSGKHYMTMDPLKLSFSVADNSISPIGPS